MQKFCWMILAIIIVGGCSQNEQGREINDNQRPNITEVKNTNIQETDRKSGAETAKRLTNLAVKVPHVNDATAVVLGKYAIVGIDIDQDIDRSQVGTIKYSVGEALQQDPYGAYATIVADPDLNERIREVAADIENGQPIRGILNELSDITSRIIPEVPGDPVEQTPNKVMSEQKQTIDNEQEQKMLEDKQNKQSNDHLD
ncbi:YhcN/YlaJ family sporulation lipoprotein [Peribacillus asahii]|uniref:YhcN/YlaJ family sporulation lipoprotein n=1 Tax=Peribacillus asahii TaxID=228899 RepID=A0A398BDH0_9BACI|nr:YhcN/YlaJ family sporulation lipoprotein [Peribacillus asahii]RID87654.1 YhcN/YlaJ family sporulation lipoprotein [Peribacillus asahii]